jgi:hypothetical protein
VAGQRKPTLRRRWSRPTDFLVSARKTRVFEVRKQRFSCQSVFRVLGKISIHTKLLIHGYCSSAYALARANRFNLNSIRAHERLRKKPRPLRKVWTWRADPVCPEPVSVCGPPALAVAKNLRRELWRLEGTQTTIGTILSPDRLQACQKPPPSMGSGFQQARGTFGTPELKRPLGPDDGHYRNVWSATELQAKNADDKWSAPMYSALGGVCDSWP